VIEEHAAERLANEDEQHEVPGVPREQRHDPKIDSRLGSST
jgi:hypothetical protein